MTKSNLSRAFRDVRQKCFPSWDRERRWRFRQVPDLNGAQGSCRRENKTILVTHLPGGEEGTLLLIHEIAHAVTDGGHGKKWQQRMEKAVVTAEQASRTELAALLRKEIVGYRNPMARVTAGLVYSEIADAVVENPELTFSQVIDCVRRDYGFCRQEFLKRFRRARTVYDREKRDAQEESKARAKFLAKWRRG